MGLCVVTLLAGRPYALGDAPDRANAIVEVIRSDSMV